MLDLSILSEWLHSFFQPIIALRTNIGSLNLCKKYYLSPFTMDRAESVPFGILQKNKKYSSMYCVLHFGLYLVLLMQLNMIVPVFCKLSVNKVKKSFCTWLESKCIYEDLIQYHLILLLLFVASKKFFFAMNVHFNKNCTFVQ